MKQVLIGALTLGAMTIGAFAQMSPAEAASLVTNGGGTVTGINELLIGSTTYNVAFKNANFTSLFGPTGTSPQPTFWQDQTGAQAAANAINSFLTGQSQLGKIFLGNASSYLVAFDLIEKTRQQGNKTVTEEFVKAIKGEPGSPWISSLVDNIPPNGGGNQPVYAVFSAVPPTPVPTPALLPGLVGLGLTALRKKKQAQDA